MLDEEAWFEVAVEHARRKNMDRPGRCRPAADRPVVSDADELSFADIEKQIIALGEKAKTGQLSIEELQGGTFTITNGGIYGSMLSTPILNPPQSGVLGMHNIVQRAVVVEGKVEVRPIMYLALSYDHRIIDGKDAVSFLVRVKEYLEDPRRLFLNL